MTHELEFHADRLPGHVNPDEEAERMPINYVELAIRYKWWLLLGLIVGAVLGHFAYAKAGPEFEAFSQILVQRKLGSPLHEDERYLTSGGKPSEHISLLTTPMILNKAIRIGELDKLESLREETDIVDAIQDRLKAKRASGSDKSFMTAVDIRFSSEHPTDAEKVVEAVTDAYSEYLHEFSTEQATKVLEKARETTAKMFTQLHEIEKQHREFLDGVPEEFRGALGPKTMLSQTTTVAPEDVIHALGEERNRVRILQADLIARDSGIREAIRRNEPREALEMMVRRYLNLEGRAQEDPDRQTQINIYQSQLLPLLNKERELARFFGRDYPELVSVRKSIELTLQTYSKLGLYFPEGANTDAFTKPKTDFISLYQESLRQQLNEARLKELELTRRIQIEGERSKQFARFQSEDENIRAEILRRREIWQKQLDRENGVSIEEDSAGYTMKVLSPVKNGLVLKKLIKYYAGGAFGGALLVGLACLVMELRDLRLKTVRDIRQVLRQPVLGNVASFVVPPDREGPDSKLPHPALRYLHAPNSIEAENYRSIRTALLVTAENQHARVVLVSSPEPGDGKSTLVSNLAVALAQSGKRVLLIDGDLRRPTTHTLFRARQEVGLTEVLNGEIDLLSAVQTTLIDRLCLLTSGVIPPNPAEVLSTPRLRRVMSQAKEEFDIVLIDAPPMLAVSDPCILARQADGMLLVVRLGKNTRASASRVRELVQTQNIHSLGVIANGVRMGQEDGYSYSYYGEYVSQKGTSPYFSREPEVASH